MGTLNEIKIYGLSKKRARAAADMGFQAMQKVDRLMSLYKEESEVSVFNRLDAMEPLQISNETFAVLKKAGEIADRSEGAFDMTIAPLVKRWGFFDKKEKPLPDEEELEILKLRCGYKNLILDEKISMVMKIIPLLEIDLGAIAKGYAVDLALEALKKYGVENASVNSGGNIGFLGLPPGKKFWEVGVKDPGNPSELIGVLQVKKGGVATSGNYEQFFEINGKRFSHILDPRTGWPVQNVLSVTVLAPNAMDADALSTALFVMGPDKGKRLAETYQAEALFILQSEKGETQMIQTPEIKGTFFTNNQD